MNGRTIVKHRRAGDRAVALGGFLIVLLTGFFGAEPAEEATARQPHAIIATVSCDHPDGCAAPR
ncbi:MAG: hypothetical protein IRY96_03775 [Burkholderiales bacterium]|nr:hypothetical protein [Burkholderiales bacterium]PZN01579.1 MAG: hypothetical protein DIU74_09900 [Pseudomonadota bacterium]